MKEHERGINDIKDDIIRDYNSIIRDSALLATVSGFLFGFLLNISLNAPRGFGPLDSIVIMISLFAITLAVSLFAMIDENALLTSRILFRNFLVVKTSALMDAVCVNCHFICTTPTIYLALFGILIEGLNK
jgi:hypothetical protein